MIELALFSIYLSSAFLLVPLSTIIYYWIKKGIRYDSNANFIAASLVWYALIFILQYYFSHKSINNLFLLRIYVPVDIFLLSNFLLNLHTLPKKITYISSSFLMIIVFAVDLIWGVFQTEPIEQAITRSIILIGLSFISIKKLNFSDPHEKAYIYFVIAIGLDAISTLGYIFSEAMPYIVTTSTAVFSIICFTLYTIGFYLLIQNKSTIGWKI